MLRWCRCRASEDCPAFLLDYARSSCFRLDTNTEDDRSLIVPTQSRSLYFIAILFIYYLNILYFINTNN